MGLVLVCILSERHVDLHGSDRVDCQRWNHHSGEVLQGRTPDSPPQELSQLDDLYRDACYLDQRISDKHSRYLDLWSLQWHMLQLRLLAEHTDSSKLCLIHHDLGIFCAVGAVHLLLLAHPGSDQRPGEGVPR